MPYERAKHSGSRLLQTFISFLIFLLILAAAFYALVRILAR
jgi:hypothetical protein